MRSLHQSDCMELPPQHLARIYPNIWALNLTAIPVSLVCGLSSILLVIALPHHHPVGDFSLFWFFPGIGVALVLHELTHAFVAMGRAKLPWSALKSGFKPKALLLYRHCGRSL